MTTMLRRGMHQELELFTNYHTAASAFPAEQPLGMLADDR